MIWVFVTLLTLIIMGASYVAYDEHKRWNKGKCECGGNWKSFGMDSAGGIGWNCDSCDNYMWTSWVIDTRTKKGSTHCE